MKSWRWAFYSSINASVNNRNSGGWDGSGRLTHRCSTRAAEIGGWARTGMQCLPRRKDIIQESVSSDLPTFSFGISSPPPMVERQGNSLPQWEVFVFSEWPLQKWNGRLRKGWDDWAWEWKEYQQGASWHHHPSLSSLIVGKVEEPRGEGRLEWLGR